MTDSKALNFDYREDQKDCSRSISFVRDSSSKTIDMLDMPDIGQMEVTLVPDEQIQKALCGDYGDQQRFIAEEGIKWVKLLLDKNADYGGTIFTVPKLAPETSSDTCIRVRMNDKIDRIMHLLSLGEEKRQLKSESIDDTFRDLGAYCLLYLVNKRINAKV